MNAPKNISASVKARLRNVAATRGEDFNLLLLRYGIERLLFRLSQSPLRPRTASPDPAPQPKDRINFTDPESTSIKTKDGVQQCKTPRHACCRLAEGDLNPRVYGD